MKQESQFLEVVGLIRQSRTKAYQSVNAELINCYWQVGEYITRQIRTSQWGENTVGELARYLENKHPELKGFDRRGLYRMRQFYETYSGSKIVSAVRSQIQGIDKQKGSRQSATITGLADIRGSILSKISWTNHRTIYSRCKTEEEREFYLRACIQENLNSRELDRQISTGLFERTMLGNQNLPNQIKKLDKGALLGFRDTYVLDFLNLPKEHTETELQGALIAEMKNFILELGKDFLFMGEEYRIQVGNSDFVIDLLFFHRGLQCLVAFELKAEKFTPEHLGQLNFYLEALDRDVKKEHENPKSAFCSARTRTVKSSDTRLTGPCPQHWSLLIRLSCPTRVYFRKNGGRSLKKPTYLNTLEMAARRSRDKKNLSGTSGEACADDRTRTYTPCGSRS
jgi:predicted nuclease of restriction endonuclease-like (RecB) superfamily